MARRIAGRRAGQGGQILVIAILLLSVLSIIVPLMVTYAQREAKWSTLQKRSTTAFHLAEAATERGYLQVVRSTTIYQSILDGTALAGYNDDVEYTDVAGGSYAIKVSSAGEDSVRIVGTGKESAGDNVRAIEVVYTDAKFGDVAIYANGGVNVSGNNFTVEWGAIMTPKSITVGTLPDYPQLFSAGNITEDTNGALPPNCDSPDCCWWHSYDANIPAAPTIDFDYYKSLAQATNTYYVGNYTNVLINDASGKTYYYTGNVSMKTNNYIKGNFIVLGNLSPSTGNWGNGSGSPTMGTKAWKQYCKSWSTYQGYDPSADASFPGLTSTYSSDETLTPVALDKICVWGFMYVGGNLNWGGGGGNADFVGVVYINGNASLGANSHANVWYNGDVASSIKATSVNLQRSSWMEVKKSWPL